MPYYAAVDDAPYIMQVVDTIKLPEQMRPRVERMKGKEKVEPYIWGHNVTERYIDIYQESIKNSKLNEDELMANIVVFDDEDTSVSESRLSCRVDVFEGDENINFGYSPRKTDDMNQFLQLKLKKESNYRLVVTNPEKQIKQEFTLATENTPIQDIQLILTN